MARFLEQIWKWTIVLSQLKILVYCLSMAETKCMVKEVCVPCPQFCYTKDMNSNLNLICQECQNKTDFLKHTQLLSNNPLLRNDIKNITCPKGKKTYHPIFGPMECLDYCPEDTYLTPDNECVLVCPPKYPIQTEWHCYKICPNHTYYDGFDCTAKCLDWQYYTIRYRCVDKCPEELPLLIESNRTCTDHCPVGTKIVEKKCVDKQVDQTTYHIFVPILAATFGGYVLLILICLCYKQRTCPILFKNDKALKESLISAFESEDGHWADYSTDGDDNDDRPSI